MFKWLPFIHKEYFVPRLGWCNQYTIDKYKLKYAYTAYMLVFKKGIQNGMDDIK